MKGKVIIGISGWAGSGKDTVYSILNDLSGGQCERISFADPLKEMCAEEYAVPLRYFHERELKDAPLEQYPLVITDSFHQGLYALLKDQFRELNGQLHWTPRALAILKGSGNRAVDGNYWMNKMMEKALSSPCPYIVVPDLRFKTEMDFLKEYNAYFIRVNRFKAPKSSDPSERDLDDAPFNEIIYNSKSDMTQLEAKVGQIARRLGMIKDE